MLKGASRRNFIRKTNTIPPKLADLPKKIQKQTEGRPLGLAPVFKVAAAPIVVVQDITIEKWNPKEERKESINKIFSQNSSLSISKNMQRQFEQTGVALLYRSQTHELLCKLEKDFFSSSKVLVLNGQRGVGKTVMLYQLANILNEKKYITIYLQMSEWISGIYPYESTENQTFTQNELAKQVLLKILAQNEQIFKKLKINSQTIEEFILKSDLKNSHLVFIKVLEHLTSPELEHKVFFAFDEINALFTKTAYSDQNSIPITSDRFEIIKSIYKIFQKKMPKNVTCVVAIDQSQTLIKSHYLDKILKKSMVLNEDPKELNLNRYQDYSKVTKFETALPDIIDRSKKDLFPKDLQLGLDFDVFTIRSFDIKEVKPMLEFYKRTNVFTKGFED